MLSEDIFFSPVTELGQKIRRHQLSPVELAEAYLARLESMGQKLNAVATITRELALEQARAAEQEIAAGKYRGPLHGIPYGAKDLLATRGIRTTWGAKPYEDQVFDFDGTVIRRLRHAGAVLVAKLAMVELAGGGGYRYAAASLTGPGKNPWNPGHWTGGSSSGSGAAVAAGLVAFAIGSETWGSIVNPSSFCGVTGMRPTYGRVSRHGAMPLSWTMDKLGPIGRTAVDCGLVLAAIAGPDPQDASSVPQSFSPATETRPARPWLAATGSGRVGVIREDFSKHGDPEVGAAFGEALKVLEASGARLADAKLPDFPYGAVADLIISAEGASVFRPLIESGKIYELNDPLQPAGLYAGLKISAADYLKAMRIRARMQIELNKLFERFDLLVAPSEMKTSPTLEADLEKYFSGGGGEIGAAGNLAGWPCVSVPMGFGKNHLPVGLQIVGRAFDEASVIALAAAYQKKTDWHRQRPPH